MKKNNPSQKTRSKIKAVFAEMLCEKKELNKISVTELVKRANISRGAFYSHYDDIYSVAEDYESEIIDQFFSNTLLLKLGDVDSFLDTSFEFIRKNDEMYKLLCKSNALLFLIKRLSAIISNKLLELSKSVPEITCRKYYELDINIFVQGLIAEYVKYCRGISNFTLDDLHKYAKRWTHEFREQL